MSKTLEEIEARLAQTFSSSVFYGNQCGYHLGDCVDGRTIEVWGWAGTGERFFEKFINVCGNCRKYLQGRFRYVEAKEAARK